MPLKANLDDTAPTISLTPIIDVMFNLVLFFVVGTQFVESERNIALKIPEVADRGALSEAPERRVINVYRDGAITLDRQDVTLDELTRQLTLACRKQPHLGVVVRGDMQGEYQHVALALNACKQAGVRELGIIVRPVRQ